MARAGGAQSDESPRRDADPSREVRRGDANATRTTCAPRGDVCARPRVCLNNGISVVRLGWARRPGERAALPEEKRPLDASVDHRYLVAI